MQMFEKKQQRISLKTELTNGKTLNAHQKQYNKHKQQEPYEQKQKHSNHNFKKK